MLFRSHDHPISHLRKCHSHPLQARALENPETSKSKAEKRSIALLAPRPSCQLVPSLDPTHLTRAVTIIQFCISENAPPTLCSLARWRTQKRPNPKLRNARLPSSLQRPSCQLIPSLDRTHLTRDVTTIQLCISENAPPTLCSLAHWKTQKRPNPKLKNS